MPAVLESFDDSAWRTKQASIQMLGAMSHLAPKQLASALPKVVPKLTEAFSDTHPKVKASAQEALNEISTVIRNPEIAEASPMLLKALTDPADETQRALEGLIATEFLHAIDAPSLALIVPIVHRGLRDRGASVKRMGGLIAGNICTMINDPRDFLPYLPTLLPDLQAALLDPIPDVRNTSAKALGTLARSLGDHILPDLRPWLIQKLRDKACSSAERSGAAQGLTEVLIASGTEVVDEVLRNELLPLADYMEASTREGVLWMITFLPPAMGQNFSPYIDVSLGPLVRGLSDDNENVRDVAMRAGRVLIRSHGKVHMDKILPSLEEGLENEDHRIRLASLSLLGNLLSTIGGTSVLRGDGDTQDDIRRAERAQAQIALVLGPDTRRRVLSKLYMARSDNTHAVRHSAIQIWKTVVSVTARALRDILAVLVNLIVTTLATGDEERTVVAGQCLGDVVTKLGESVLPQIIPVLRNSLYNGDEQTKRGVCVGLTDVLKGSTKEQILRFLEIITKLVQDALSDDDEQVRSMASACFQELYNLVGTLAFDEIVPSLMVSLANNDNENEQRRALNGLTGILAVRSRELLPYIIPRLISRPISANHARALGRISSVTPTTIQNHLSSIIPTIIFELAESTEADERIDAVRECSRDICASVGTSGVNTLIGEIAAKCGSDKPAIGRECCGMFSVVVTERKFFLGKNVILALNTRDDKEKLYPEIRL
jgi:HEAT repeat protein